MSICYYCTPGEWYNCVRTAKIIFMWYTGIKCARTIKMHWHLRKERIKKIQHALPMGFEKPNFNSLPFPPQCNSGFLSRMPLSQLSLAPQKAVSRTHTVVPGPFQHCLRKDTSMLKTHCTFDKWHSHEQAATSPGQVHLCELPALSRDLSSSK